MAYYYRKEVREMYGFLVKLGKRPPEGVPAVMLPRKKRKKREGSQERDDLPPLSEVLAALPSPASRDDLAAIARRYDLKCTPAILSGLAFLAMSKAQEARQAGEDSTAGGKASRFR